MKKLIPALVFAAVAVAVAGCEKKEKALEAPATPPAEAPASK